jgi:hypothetical protein
MDDHHFGYIEGEKKPGHILWSTISCIIKQLSISPHTYPDSTQLEMTKQTVTKQHQNDTRKRHKTKRTQITLWVQEIQETKPSSYLWGGGCCGGGITTTYQVLNCLRMEHAQNGKQKIVSNFALGKASKKNKVG